MERPSLILHEIEEQNRVLNKLKENIKMFNQMKTSYYIIIQLLDGQLGQKISCLYSLDKEGTPSDTMDISYNEV